MRVRYQPLVLDPPTARQLIVWCPAPYFDMGQCLECGRTTVDHLVDLNNARAVDALRADPELQTARYFSLAVDVLLGRPGDPTKRRAADAPADRCRR